LPWAGAVRNMGYADPRRPCRNSQHSCQRDFSIGSSVYYLAWSAGEQSDDRLPTPEQNGSPALSLASGAAQQTLLPTPSPGFAGLNQIVDNYATHEHAKVRTWLARRPRYHLHYISHVLRDIPANVRTPGGSSILRDDVNDFRSSFRGKSQRRLSIHPARRDRIDQEHHSIPS
jgi:hypothetical protein